MKNVIDIPEQWEGCTNRHLRKCISEGTPLTEVFEVIKEEIDKLHKVGNANDGKVYVPINDVFDVIDNHISAEGGNE